MNCPNCGGKTKVIDSRDSEFASVHKVCWWRRRVCIDCKNRFTTYEILPDVLIDAKIMKRKLQKVRKILEEED